jgi:hypothetical protein
MTYIRRLRRSTQEGELREVIMTNKDVARMALELVRPPRVPDKIEKTSGALPLDFPAQKVLILEAVECWPVHELDVCVANPSPKEVQA